MHPIIPLTESRRYRVTYLPAGARVARVMVAQYLGTDQAGLLLWNLRPHAGTQTMWQDQLLAAVPSDEKIQLPRKA